MVSEKYSPAECQIFDRLAAALRADGVPVRSLRVFGSRARGRSDAHSDLDIAVLLDGASNRAMAKRIAAVALDLSRFDETTGLGIRVQAVPMFRGDEQGFFARTIARDADTVWTTTA
jgi:predicted nucleotidyltransferase